MLEKFRFRPLPTGLRAPPLLMVWSTSLMIQEKPRPFWCVLDLDLHQAVVVCFQAILIFK